MWCQHYDFVLHAWVGMGYEVQKNVGPVFGSNSLGAEIEVCVILIEVSNFGCRKSGKSL